MELLTAIQRDTIDPEYGSHYGEDRHDRRRHRWLAVLVSFLAGLMFATSSMGAGRGNDNVASERADLIAQVNQAELRNKELRSEADELAEQVQELEEAQLGRQVGLDKSSLVWSGMGAVTGPGLALTITENPLDDAGILIDQDIRQVVNGLWLAGAEAVSVNGYRLSSRTAIRQAGSAITVDYRSLTAPYRIEAIGDPDSLASRFESGPGGAWLNFLKRNHGVGWTMESRGALELDADGGLGVDKAGVR